jgi:uncharacterized protein YkwD
LGDYTSAELDCTKAIELQNDYAQAYYNRGLVRRDRQNISLAIDDLNVAMKLYDRQGMAKNAQEIRSEIMEIERSQDKLPTVSPNDPTSPLVLSIHNRINQYRTSHNLPTLELSPIISAIAQKHSQEMVIKDDLTHEGFNERAELIKKSLKFNKMAENVAYNEGYPEPDVIAVKGWIESPPHEVNLTGKYNLTGIGVARKNGKYYFTQIFVNQVK